MATERSKERDYLEKCLAEGIPAVRARALRALAALRVESKRTLCESILKDDWTKVGQELNLPPEKIAEEDRNRLRNAAMESLRDIGNEESIEALREARQQAVGMLSVTVPPLESAQPWHCSRRTQVLTSLLVHLRAQSAASWSLVATHVNPR